MPMAEMTGVPYRRFLVFDLVGSFLWVGGVTSLGILMATQVGVIAVRLQRLGSMLALMRALALVIDLSLRLRKRLRYGQPMVDSKGN